MIQKAKDIYWVEWLENLVDGIVWSVVRYMDQEASDRGRTRVPGLRMSKEILEVEQDNQGKSMLLYNTFFLL